MKSNTGYQFLFKAFATAALLAGLVGCNEDGPKGPEVTMTAPPAPPPAAGATDITQVGSAVQITSRTQELTLTTPAITGETKIRVTLPEGYDPNGTTRYPVIYLYHGGGGNQTDWTRPANAGKAEEISAGVPVILVMPSGGAIGYYTDAYNGGNFGPPMWETYHVRQLVPWIDENFKTIAQRSARAMAGLSMGGGGLRYTARYPDVIGITASFSGALDMTDPEQATIALASQFPQFNDISGPFATQEVRHRGVSATDLAGNLSNTNIFLSSGDTGFTESTMVIRSFNATKARLDHFGIPYVASLYPGMGHTWSNWNRAFAEWLPIAMAYFNDPAKQVQPPPSFRYSTIATNYQVWGWNVGIARTALEFSALEVADQNNFSVIGSGEATVQTAPLAQANAIYKVTLTGGSPNSTKTIYVRTDAAGRAVIPVVLGPANPFQQFTAESDAGSTSEGPDASSVPFIVRGSGSRFYTVKVALAPYTS